MKLAKWHPEFVEADAEIIAVGPDQPGDFQKFFAEHRIAFPGIPDPEHVLADTYGQEVKWWKLGRLPAQFLISPPGVVRFSEYSRSMAAITPPEELLALVKPATST